MQLLFAHYALKWKSYHLNLISIRYMFLFFVSFYFGKIHEIFSTTINLASRKINADPANQITFPVGDRVPRAELKQDDWNIDFSMSVTMSARTLPIRSQTMVQPVARPSRTLSLNELSTKGVIPRRPGPRRERRARKVEEHIGGARQVVEVRGLTQEKLKHPEGKDPVAAA